MGIFLNVTLGKITGPDGFISFPFTNGNMNHNFRLFQIIMKVVFIKIHRLAFEKDHFCAHLNGKVFQFQTC